jgi:hypothetical protein
MSVLLFFNELSCTTEASPDDVDTAMTTFVGILTQITRLRRDATLVSAVSIRDLELARGYFVQQWRGKKSLHREQMRKIQSMRQQAPFKPVLPEGAGEDAEYILNGRNGMAVAGAHLMDGMLVSLPISQEWAVACLCVDRKRLTENPDGDVVIVEDAVDVRHASTDAHVTIHESWIKSAGVAELRTGAELWAARDGLYPNLLFLPRAEQLFTGLLPEWVVPLATELRRIDDSIGDWDPTVCKYPAWRSYITVESETGKRHCWFEDFDGEIRLFDLHGRFTPGPGRVHFRLVADQRKATIAYAGRKIGS